MKLDFQRTTMDPDSVHVVRVGSNRMIAMLQWHKEREPGVIMCDATERVTLDELQQMVEELAARAGKPKASPRSVHDAAVLFFATNGTRSDLTCRHLIDLPDDEARYCGEEIGGVSADDGSPLCIDHITGAGGGEEDGYTLSPEVLAEIRRMREKLP